MGQSGGELAQRHQFLHLKALLGEITNPVGHYTDQGLGKLETGIDHLDYCRDLGLITQKNPIRFANPIYREIITRILNSPLQERFPEEISETAWYLDEQGRLIIASRKLPFT